MHPDFLSSRFFPKLMLLHMVLLHMVLLPVVALSAEKTKKTIIGGVEEILLLPWRIRVPARVDTGAARSSLGAQQLNISGVVAEFKLREAVGGHRLRLPILDWRIYRTSEGTDRRPVVEIEICIGQKRLRTRVNLNQRRHLKYPLLIGRGLLSEGNFLVDVTRGRTMKPDCDKAREGERSAISPALTPGRR